MNIKSLSASYTATPLTSQDVNAVLELCIGNPKFYRHCPPLPSESSILADMQALPKGKTAKDKYYIGFWDGDKLIAVLDLILKYPDDQTAFIGFFMLDARRQGQGIGSRLIQDIAAHLKSEYGFIRLGYVKGNDQSERFWLQNGFEPTGTTVQTELYEIVFLQKSL